MRIAMISEHANPLTVLDECGQNLHVDGLSSARVRAGHEVTVFTRWDDPTQMSPRCSTAMPRPGPCAARGERDEIGTPATGTRHAHGPT